MTKARHGDRQRAPTGHARGDAMFVAAQSLGALYRASYAANRIDIFNDAASLSGNVAPARSLSGAGTTLHNPSGLAVDQTRNVLCVASRRVASRRAGVSYDPSTDRLQQTTAGLMEVAEVSIFPRFGPVRASGTSWRRKEIGRLRLDRVRFAM